ncbi:hypothetical protein RINTHH_18970 [Richelia intracellularis HH01]|jgi:hypothetical protein|uniref:Uncharacterized protein n=1 Tax=Richelia intracellularis HH01 TaxID=1165094 RepID=M1X014_9NOST|nr:hypothetical protein RINTHH_18970 [Richelia intracellularis HH01]
MIQVFNLLTIMGIIYKLKIKNPEINMWEIINNIGSGTILREC